MKDDGCPTCGSKNFGVIEMIREDEKSSIWKMQCYNCKKFWQMAKESGNHQQSTSAII